MEPDMLSDAFLDICPLSPGTSSWLAELNDSDDTSRSIGSCHMATEGERTQPLIYNQAYPGTATGSNAHMAEQHCNLQPLESNTQHVCLPLPAQSVPELRREWNVFGPHPVNMYPIHPSVMQHIHGTKTGSSQDFCAHSPHRIRQSRRAKPRIPDLQLRLEQLTNHFKKLSEENSFLRNKLKALERVVPNRSAHVSFLAASLGEQLSQPPPSFSAPHPTGQSPNAPTAPSDSSLAPLPTSSVPQLPPAATSILSSPHPSAVAAPPLSNSGISQSCDVHIPSCDTPGSEPGSGSGARDATWLVEEPQQMMAPKISTTGSGTHPTVPASCVGAWATAAPLTPLGTPAVVALCPCPDGEVPAITAAAVEELKRVSPQDFRALWKHVCLQLGVLVVAAEALGPNSPQHERLQRYLERVYVYMDRVVLLAPDSFLPNMYVNIETGEHERPPEEFWVAMGNVLNLNALQREQMESLAMVYRQNVVPVVRERARLASELSVRIAASSSSRAEGLQALDAIDKLTQQLRRNVLKEHQTHCDISDFICLSVLTPLQLGKVMAASYPYIPDGVAIMHAGYGG